MSEETTAVQPQHTFVDYLIVVLSSLGVGMLAGLVVFWVLQLTPWALEQLDAPLSGIPRAAYYVDLARLYLPWLVGLVMAGINFFKMKALE